MSATNRINKWLVVYYINSFYYVNRRRIPNREVSVCIHVVLQQTFTVHLLCTKPAMDRECSHTQFLPSYILVWGNGDKTDSMNKITTKELDEATIGRSRLLQYGTPGRPLSQLCTHLEDRLWWRREKVAMKSSLEIVACSNPLRYREALAWHVAWTHRANSRRVTAEVIRELEKAQMVSRALWGTVRGFSFILSIIHFI